MIDHGGENIMKYPFMRRRSDFWITVYKNDDGSVNVSTNIKYIDIINFAFPSLECNSPTKWKKSENFDNVYSLWLPEGCLDDDLIPAFLGWCQQATNDVLWLGLNRNIQDYFCDELDFCLATDFNIVYGEGRTMIGEAEYQLKYNYDYLDMEKRVNYFNAIIVRMIDACKYIPFINSSNWYVSPMPATDGGRNKLAWAMAEEISRRLSLPFVAPLLKCDKPQMKQLSIKEKIETWDKIYYNNGVEVDSSVKGKKIIVIDDLYQSGITMWEYARFLKSLGASLVFGMVCVKSLKDSDNT